MYATASTHQVGFPAHKVKGGASVPARQHCLQGEAGAGIHALQ